ncbi:MAG: phenylalanine--tRNA ligase subunit beta [Synergistaceae bacterium]|jgi:phenylalanyl-tRNA synthetase beta chain|nr:phenylalanine--tRNA ligase subunit beta [Synergistaceae bacterium]
MIVSWRILEEFLTLPEKYAPEEVAERLTMAGAEVESIERRDISGVTVARIASLDRHPTKGHLFVAKLDTGLPEKRDAVCVTAATNLKAGDMVFYAAPGAVAAGLPELAVRDFDGVTSDGMMLSAEELGLPEIGLEEGILRLPGDAPIGAEAGVAYGIRDTLLNVSVTPNRGDLLSVLGMAREINGLFSGSDGLALKPMPWKTHEQAAKWPIDFGDISLPDPGCVNYHLGLAVGVNIAPSPLDVRIALTHMGMRPISNVVDATNYVMLVLGQPLHAFDLNTLPAREITVRTARDGERIMTLDGKERVMTDEDMLITSGGEPIAIAGVMGGDKTGIADDTKVVLLEGANFSAQRVGRTSRRLGLTSEAAFRYSRGVDPALAAMGIDYALHLMHLWGSADVSFIKRSAFNAVPAPAPIKLTKKKLQTYLLWSDMNESARILRGFGIEPAEPRSGDDAAFVPPTWRPDITIEEDLIEEIGRYRGYNDMPDLLPGEMPRRGDMGAPTLLASALRGTLISRGYTEVITYSFLPESFVQTLNLPSGDRRASLMRLLNPISQDWSVMRTTLVPGLLNGLRESVAAGRRGPVRMFEIGRAFFPSADGHIEEDHLAGLVCGGLDPRTPWKETVDDFLSVKSDLEAVVLSRGITPVFERSSEPFGHAGQTASVSIRSASGGSGDQQKIGFLARLSLALEREMDFPGAVYLFELDLSGLEAVVRPAYFPTPQFPASLRDISMFVPNRRGCGEVVRDIRAAVEAAGAGAGLLESVALFDVYAPSQDEKAGKSSIPAGFRSMAFTMSYRAPDRTLDDAEVDGIQNAAREALARKGYGLR